MNQDSLLPRSLFSASTLKREPVEEALSSFPGQQQQQPKRRRKSITQQQTSNEAIVHHTNAANDPRLGNQNQQKLRSQQEMALLDEDMDDNNHNADTSSSSSSSSSSNSTSSSSSSEDENDDIEINMLRQDNVSTAHISHTMHHLLLKLERQQSKQNKYLEKFKQLNKSIKKTNRLISYNANLLTQTADNTKSAAASPSSTPVFPPQTAKRSTPIETSKNKQQQKQQKQHNIDISSDEEDIELNVASTQQQQQRASNKSFTRFPFPAPSKITPIRKVFKEVEFSKSDRMDIFTPRRKQGEVMFKKKPRSLLYNIANENTAKGIHELMITTSLDGELHFWNTEERKKIKTIGSDHLYDTWIDGICWATPATLAFCPPQKSEEPVKLIHIGNTSKTNVEGRIQSLDDSPHENGISVIESLDTGAYNTRTMEKCSFLTGGYDKSVYVWSLKRESPHDNFTNADVSRLNIKHTSYILSLCYDKYHNTLFTGGADERLILFDMQTDSTIREMRLGQRVNQIMQSKANPNIMLITVSSTVEQFSMYDQRCPGFDGIKLRFGQPEQDNLSRFTKPDMHENGYTVCCGSQGSSKLNFWDLRYTGVARNISFSMDTPSTSKILIPKFIPNTNTVVSVSSTRSMSWIDYQIKQDEIVKTLM